MNGGPTALLDTSVLVARELGRRVDAAAIPNEVAVTVVTIGELHAGVLSAPDVESRARRLDTLDWALATDPLPVTAAAARRWAELRTRLAEDGRRAKVNDLWIAAIAAANGLDVVTENEDFDPIEAVGGPRIIRV